MHYFSTNCTIYLFYLSLSFMQKYKKKLLFVWITNTCIQLWRISVYYLYLHLWLVCTCIVQMFKFSCLLHDLRTWKVQQRYSYHMFVHRQNLLCKVYKSLFTIMLTFHLFKITFLNFSSPNSWCLENKLQFIDTSFYANSQ